MFLLKLPREQVCFLNYAFRHAFKFFDFRTLTLINLFILVQEHKLRRQSKVF